jgi:hypothetical protein
MKYVAVFIISVLLVSNVHANENLNGKALECVGVKNEPADISYWTFEQRDVVLWYVADVTPLKIKKWNYRGYKTYTNRISWGDYFSVNRESLVFSDSRNGKLKEQCKLITPAEVEKKLNTKIDKLRASMKDNKF